MNARPPANFAHMVMWAMIRSAAVETIGLDGFALVAVVAHHWQEVRYQHPVAFHLPTLMALVEHHHKTAYYRTERACIAAGWLGKDVRPGRQPSLYWVAIPDEVVSLLVSPNVSDSVSPNVSQVVSPSVSPLPREGREVCARDTTTPPPPLALGPQGIFGGTVEVPPPLEVTINRRAVIVSNAERIEHAGGKVYRDNHGAWELIVNDHGLEAVLEAVKHLVCTQIEPKHFAVRDYLRGKSVSSKSDLPAFIEVPE